MLRAVGRALLVSFLVSSFMAGPQVAQAESTTWGKVKGKYRGDASQSMRDHTSSPSGQIITDDPGPQYSSAGGDNENLPVGSQVTNAQLVTWARSMPAVQQAMAEMNGRGYIPHPESDTAQHWNSSGSYGSCVVLPYERPVAVLSDTKLGECYVLVTSILNPSTGVTDTHIQGGMIIFDAVAQYTFAADSLADYAASDPSFEIAMDAGGGSGDDPGIIRPGAKHVERYDWGSGSRFNRVAACTGAVAAGAAAGFFTAAIYGGPASWVGMAAASGWGIAGIVVISLAIGYMSCSGVS